LNWITFLIVAWLAFGLQMGFDAFRLAPGDISPSFVVPLLVFIALSAPAKHALWAALLIGLLIDLTWLIPRTDGGEAIVIGPHALGALLAAQLVLSVRGMVIRRHFLTLIILSIVAASVMAVVVVAFMTVRDLYGDPIDFSPTGELVSRLLSAVTTGGSALAWALVLRPIEAGFQFHHERGMRRH
jgi:hypothetical protein